MEGTQAEPGLRLIRKREEPLMKTVMVEELQQPIRFWTIIRISRS